MDYFNSHGLPCEDLANGTTVVSTYLKEFETFWSCTINSKKVNKVNYSFLMEDYCLHHINESDFAPEDWAEAKKELEADLSKRYK